MIKLKDILKQKEIELGKVYTAKDMPPFKVEEEKLSEMKVNKGKVDKTYKSVLNHMRKVIKKLNDDEMYEVTTKLKQWFNKNIM